MWAVSIWCCTVLLIVLIVVTFVSFGSVWIWTRRRAPASPPNIAAPTNVPSQFQEAYGSGERWVTGSIATDVVSITDDKSKNVFLRSPGQHFGVLQMGSMDVGNTYPGTSETATDGIVGFQIGCLERPGNCDVYVDFVSQLAKSGTISERTFSICLEDDISSGVLSLGAVQSTSKWTTAAGARASSNSIFESSGSAKGSTTIQLVPLENRQTFYIPEAPSGGNHLVLRFGQKEISTIHSTDYTTMLENKNVFLDTGTGGMLLPSSQYNATLKATFEAWANNSAVVTEFASMMGLMASEITDDFIAKLMDPATAYGTGSVVLSASLARAIQVATPPLSFDFGEGKVMTVAGSTFLYETISGSGRYSIAWWSMPKEEMLVWGSAYPVGKTMTINTADLNSPYLVEHTANAAERGRFSCSDENYGEYRTPITANPSLTLGSMIMTTRLSLGTPPQQFDLQIDTGSQDLLVYDEHCKLLGVNQCQGGIDECETCFSVLPSPNVGAVLEPYHTQLMEFNNMSPECWNYAGAFVTDMEHGWYDQFGHFPIMGGGSKSSAAGDGVEGLYGFTVNELMATMSQTLRPYASCGATRELCGNLHMFHHQESSTFRTVPEESTFHNYEFALSTSPWMAGSPTCASSDN